MGFQMGHQTKMIEDVLTRLRAEYLEMPGLRLKAGQVQRLCGIDQTMCQLVLDSLLELRVPEILIIPFPEILITPVPESLAVLN